MIESANLIAFLPWLMGLVAVGGLMFQRHARRNLSVHSNDSSLTDVAFTLVSNFGARDTQRGVDGRTRMVPPFGHRFLMPGLLIVVLYFADVHEMLAQLGVRSVTHQSILVWTLGSLIAVGLFQVMFRQSVTYDEHEIIVTGVSIFRRETRDLRDLVDIGVHEKRPTLVLSFADGSRTYVPNYLNGRDRFVQEMSAIVERNRAQGATPMPRSFAAWAGF